MTEFEKFLEERSKIPIPVGDVAWVKLLAKELAIGANRDLWSPHAILMDMAGGAKAVHPNSEAYFEQRWEHKDLGHMLDILLAHEYFIRTASNQLPKLTIKAFDLVEEVEPYNIFISYRRLDSSALALLVLARLKEHNLAPFVDMALEAGGNWHADLEDRIKECDYFIILLGEHTLESDMTVKEIGWAVDANRTIIPIWHSGFDIRSQKWETIPRYVKDAIQQTNAIPVPDESASGYNTAIVQLLNRFGITP